MLECVVNLSEGRDPDLLAACAASAGPRLADLHRDPDHHRAVLTLAGPDDEVAEAARSLARAAVARLDLRTHEGVHPRLGVLDVVPFVPYVPGRLPPDDVTGAVARRDEFGRWLGDELGVPVFLYGPLPAGGTRTLPEVRRQVPAGLRPDFGPPSPDPRTGSSAVGARGVLVAYNVWVSSVTVARRVAPLLRGPGLRTLGLAVGSRAQVSCNLVDPGRLGPAEAYDAIRAATEEVGGSVEGAELVGLIPEAVLAVVPRHRWAELGLGADATVESRLGLR